MLNVIEDLIKERLIPTKEFIHQFFEIETGYINTRHPDFLDSATRSIIKNNREEETDSEFQKKIGKRKFNEIELIKKMLFDYFEVVKKNVCDYIPKIILTLLVTKTLKMSERVLIERLYKPEKIEELLKETEERIL